MNVPLDTNVECVDGPCGESTNLVINPATGKVTFLVVEDQSVSPILVKITPISLIQDTSQNLIRLSCTRAQFADLEPFIENRFIKGEVTGYDHHSVAYDRHMHMMPLATRETYHQDIRVEVERIPVGQTKIFRGMQVDAVDGQVGKVGELLIDPENGDITHLILMEGHLWGKKEIAVPVSAVENIQEDRVILSLDKQAIETLPAIPMKHAWKDIQIQDLELMIWVFDEVGTAEQALKALKQMARRSHFTVFNSAVISKDQAGDVSLKEQAASKTVRGTLLGAVTGGLIGLVVGPGGAILGAAAGAATGRSVGRIDGIFPEEKLQNLQELMTPGSSSLVVLIERSWFDKARDSLTAYNGELIHKGLTEANITLLEEEFDK